MKIWKLLEQRTYQRPISEEAHYSQRRKKKNSKSRKRSESAH